MKGPEDPKYDSLLIPNQVNGLIFLSCITVNCPFTTPVWGKVVQVSSFLGRKLRSTPSKKVRGILGKNMRCTIGEKIRMVS